METRLMNKQGITLSILLILLAPLPWPAAESSLIEEIEEPKLIPVKNAQTPIIEDTIQAGMRAFQAKHYDRAINHFQQAIQLANKADKPALAAAAQVDLANALLESAIQDKHSDGLEQLNRAIAAYRASLTVFTAEAMPELWALVTNKLAFALCTKGTYIGGSEGMALLREAADDFRDSLNVRTRKAMPNAWAETQNNLASALQEMGNRTLGAQGDTYLQEAIDRYLQALDEVSRAEEATRWAQIQDNLGRALWDQSVRASVTPDMELALLEQAITIFRTALEIRTIKDHPQDHAQTRHNLAEVLNNFAYNLTRLPERHAEAEVALEEALQINPGNPYYLDSQGWLAYQQGDLDRAESLLQQSLAKLPHPQHASHLAEVYWKKGRSKDAQQLLTRMLKQFPDDGDLLMIQQQLAAD